MGMKSLRDWIDAERGRAAALAAHLGVSPARLTQIADAGVPVKFMLQVRDFTGGSVSLESMVTNRKSLRAKVQRPSAAPDTEAAAAGQGV